MNENHRTGAPDPINGGISMFRGMLWALAIEVAVLGLLVGLRTVWHIVHAW
jgi:hypothetical protein